jgi:hypothetical protein
MKKIEELTVKVTYKVGLGDLEVPKDVFDELNEIFDNGGEFDGMGDKYPNARNWLNSKINQNDCFDCEYSIENLFLD